MNKKENDFFGDIKQIFLKQNREKVEKAAIYVLLGIFLLLIASPSAFQSKKKLKENEKTTIDENYDKNNKKDEYIDTLENRLEQIIEGMEGVGKTHVMITLRDNGEKILDKNQPYENETKKEQSNESKIESTRTRNESETVLTELDGNTIPIVIQERYPMIEGVVVVCDGGGNSTVALHIKEVIQALFSVDAHKVVVCERNQNGKDS